MGLRETVLLTVSLFWSYPLAPDRGLIGAVGFSTRFFKAKGDLPLCLRPERWSAGATCMGPLSCMVTATDHRLKLTAALREIVRPRGSA